MRNSSEAMNGRSATWLLKLFMRVSSFSRHSISSQPRLYHAMSMAALELAAFSFAIFTRPPASVTPKSMSAFRFLMP